MRKKYLSALLFGALLFASAGTFTSCKDYDDDINNLQEQINTVVSDLASLKSQIATQYVQSVTFNDETGELVVTTMANGSSSSQTYIVKTSAGAGEVSDVDIEIKGQDLVVNGETIGKVGDTVTVDENGELTVNGKGTGITVGKYTILTDKSQGTVTIQLPNANGEMETVTLMTSSAALTSVQIEDLETSEFTNVERNSNEEGIQWGIATKATPDWAGTKGAIAMNQLLIGQISTVNVQVTPADYDLGAQELTLVDARGNKAPVKVEAVANNLLLPASRTASSNGSWILTVNIDETQVNAANIADIFKYDPEASNSELMGYTLCVNGKPYTTFDFSVNTAGSKSNNPRPISVDDNNLMFIDANGRVKKVKDGKIPVGTTTLYVADSDLYDYYLTFEGTNKSLANQYGIKIGDDKKSIEVPAGAEGVKIAVTVHTASVTGQISPVAGDATSVNQVKLQITGTEIEAAEIAATTHEVKPGDALREIRVDFKTADGKNVFESFPAANLEAARRDGQFKVVESANQVGFLVKSEDPTNGQREITNVQYYKADNTQWMSTDDLLDLSYMKITVSGKVAEDAMPGDYKLAFIATERDNHTVLENELVKVTVPVTIAVPTFDELFTQDANWNDTKDTYTARIIIDGTDATLRYSNAFGKTGTYNVETSHINISFNALDSYNNYPIDLAASGAEETVTNNRRVVTTPISNDVTLDKDNVYNTAKTALKVSELTEMYAYYDVFDNVDDAIMGRANYDAVRQAFTVTSKAFTTQIKTALDGITAAVYKDNNVVNNVVLNSDKTITQGSGNGSESAKFNGFVFRLNGDYLYVNKDNLDMGNTYDKLDIFTLFDPNETSPSFTGNLVKVIFEGANRETIKWNTSNQYLQFGINTDASTLKITFKDATGIEYKQEVKVQKPAN